MRINLTTLGCKVNYCDGEALLSRFADAGHEIVDTGAPAGVYIVNTCAVTSLAARKSRQAIRQARAKNPGAIIVACGCQTQLDAESAAADGADIIAGTNGGRDIVYTVENYRKNCGTINIVKSVDNACYERISLSRFSGRHRIFIKVQDGCDGRCAYCIVPDTRGPARSRPPEDVSLEALKIAAAGYKEIVLTGIHLASYGKDLHDIDLAGLLARVHETDGIERIRLSSLEPGFITDEILAVMKNLPKLCPHFHLSLQSGSDSILTVMNRKYTAGEYIETVRRIRSAIPNAAFTTDIIVGFPGETDDDFNESLKLADAVGFMKIHVFPYSARPGTAAATMPGQVSGSVRKARAAAMQAKSNELAEKYYLSLIGKEARVLIETTGKDSAFGHAENYAPVRILSAVDVNPGKIVRVNLTSHDKDGMKGIIVTAL